jgi:hypothetical protein
MMSIFMKLCSVGTEIVSVWELAEWWHAVSSNIRAIKLPLQKSVDIPL